MLNHVNGDLNDDKILKKIKSIGLTAGASAPEELVKEVVMHLREMAPLEVRTLQGVVERVEFKLPQELNDL